jgi:hypothetical protein
VSDEHQAPIPVQRPQQAEPAKPPPPPARPVARLLGKSAGRRPFRLPVDGVVNTGDLVGRLGTGVRGAIICGPPQDWPRTGPVEDMRRSFAASFVGVSAVTVRPNRPVRGDVGPPAYDVGGEWEFPTAGDVKAGDPLGPAIDPETGHMLGWCLEVVPEDQAIATALAAADEAEGWKVRFRG